MRAAFGDLVDNGTRHACSIEGSCRAFGGANTKPHSQQFACYFYGAWLVAVLDRDKDTTFARQFGTCTQLGFDKRLPKGLANPHDLASGLHLGTENGVNTRELDKGEHRLFHTEIRRVDLLGDALRSQRLTDHAAGCYFGELNARGLADKWYGARGAWINFQHKNDVLPILVLNGKLHVHQTHHVQGFGHGGGLTFDLYHCRSAQTVGWK